MTDYFVGKINDINQDVVVASKIGENKLAVSIVKLESEVFCRVSNLVNVSFEWKVRTALVDGESQFVLNAEITNPVKSARGKKAKIEKAVTSPKIEFI